MLFVRWNPDAWKVKGDTIRVSKKEKMEVLWKTIEPFAEESSSCEDFGTLKVIFLYYPSTFAIPVQEFTKEELEEKINMLFSQ